MSWLKYDRFVIVCIIIEQYLLATLNANVITRGQLNRDLSPGQQYDGLNLIDEELISKARGTVKSNLDLRIDDGCYDRIRLPDHIKPSHYDLVMEPDLNKLTFQGAVAINIDIDMSHLNSINDNQSENYDPNLLKKSTANGTNEDIDRSSIIHDNQIILHMNDLELINSWYLSEKNQAIKVKEACVCPKYQVIVLNLGSSLTSGQGRIYMTFKGQLRDDMKGFYKSQYTGPNGQIRYHATTQFQATEARKAFPCFDEPAFKATFDVTLITPKNRLALSNTHAISELDLVNKRAIKFATSPLMSTYLLAFIVGEFDFVEGTSRGRPIKVYTPLGKKKLGEFALNVALRALPFLEDYFKISFPLKKIDLVAVPDFDAGAMENWGLITYRETQLLIDEDNSSLYRKTVVAQTVAHELAHQWFGNLVTMFWWDDLWLNEGFATYMEYHVINELFPEYSMMSKFIIEAHTTAMSDDASHTTHPIQATVNDPVEIDDIFDNISYFKGASTVRLLHEYLTNEVFRAGLRHYLSKNAYSNTKTIDLWDSFETVSGKPIRDMMRSWTDQPGFPCLDVSIVSSDNEMTELSIVQKRFLADDTFAPGEDKKAQWIIPITIVTGNNPNTIAHSTLLSSKATRIKIKNDKSWIKLNPDFGGFYCVNYDKSLRESLYSAIKSKQISVLDRMNLLSDAYSLALSGRLTAYELLKMMTYYIDEEDGAVWEVINDAFVSMYGAIRTSVYKDRFKEFAQQLFKTVYGKYGWEKKPDEPISTTMARATILSACLLIDYRPAIDEGLRRFNLHITKQKIADPSIRGVVYYAGAEFGSEKNFTSLFELYNEINFREEQDVLANSLAIIENSERVPRVIAWIMGGSLRESERHEYLLSVPASEKGRDILWKLLDENFDKYLRRFGSETLARIIKATGSSFRGPITSILAMIDKFFENHNFEFLDETKEDIVAIVKVYAKAIRRDSKLIEQFLQDYLGGEPLKPSKKRTNNNHNSDGSIDSGIDTDYGSASEPESEPEESRVSTRKRRTQRSMS